MTLEVYLLYLATVGVFFARPPGPSQLLFMAGSMQYGLRPALPIIAGDLSANSVQIAIAGFGLTGAIALSAGIFTAIKWAGVAYLVWIGIRTLIAARRSSRPRTPPPPGMLYRQGFVTSAANPYAVVFFAALFPQFIDPAAPVAPQVAMLGATYLLVDGMLLVLLGALAARLVSALGGHAARWLGYVSGIGLILAAAMLALRGAPEAR
jgi:threonine/homoserine/homoserine lactone efflux protein